MTLKTTIKISFSKTAPAKNDTVVILTDDKKSLGTQGKKLDKTLKGLLAHSLKTQNGFDGKNGETLIITLPQRSPYARLVVLGTGKGKELDALSAEKAGNKLFQALNGLKSSKITLMIDKQGTNLDEAVLAAHLGAGARLAAYRFDKYKNAGKAKKAQTATTLTLVLNKSADAAKQDKLLAAESEGVYLARNLVYEPANILYPESYAKIIASELKPLGVSVEILDEKKMKQLGFVSHLNVGMGSKRPSRVVVMRWNGGKKTGTGKDAPLAFVGKGVTFDTGGISLKPGPGMEMMKMDMGGSAAVVGLMKTLATRKAKANVVGVVGLAENMPSDRAYRPGDIINTMAGKTVEVLNTDAEGRLVLCDALTYVQKKYKPATIIDLATLTGAIVGALGFDYFGAFVNNDKLWGQLESASKASGEKLWRMPLDKAYRKEMESDVADLKNLGGKWGGACTAAGFLEHFIEDDTPWAHLDIAATCFMMPSDPSKAGTGVCVRLLNRFVAAHYES